MIQETVDDYKLQWLTKNSYRVKLPKNLKDSGAECLAWCTSVLDEKVWSHSFNPEDQQYTFFFESPHIAEQFRAQWKIGDSRTVDIT